MVRLLAGWYNHRMRSMPFPSTPAQVRECLSQAAEGVIAIGRDGAPEIVIMPFEEYARLVRLDQATARNHEIAEATARSGRLADLEAGAERVRKDLLGPAPDHGALLYGEDGLPR